MRDLEPGAPARAAAGMRDFVLLTGFYLYYQGPFLPLLLRFAPSPGRGVSWCCGPPDPAGLGPSAAACPLALPSNARALGRPRAAGCEVGRGEDGPAAFRGLGDKGDAPGCLHRRRRRSCGRGVDATCTAAAIRSGHYAIASSHTSDIDESAGLARVWKHHPRGLPQRAAPPVLWMGVPVRALGGTCNCSA